MTLVSNPDWSASISSERFFSCFLGLMEKSDGVYDVSLVPQLPPLLRYCTIGVSKVTLIEGIY
jgi:hypothetical protein